MNDGRKRKGQKHQYKTAFKIQFDPLALEIHKKVSLRGLCKRCAEQLQWRMQFNKYKKMTEPAKCTFCHQKNVFRSYMRACEPCSQQKNVCPKCLETQTEEQIENRLNEAEQKKQDQQEEKNMNDFLKKLKERSRRTVKRQYEKGTIVWNNQLLQFTGEEGNIFPVQFRQAFADSASKKGQSDDDDYDICDEQGNQSDIDSEEQQQTEHNKRAEKQNRKESSSSQEINSQGQQGEEEEGLEQGEAEQDQKKEEPKKVDNKKVKKKNLVKSDEPEVAEVKSSNQEGEWQDIEEDTQDLVQSTTKKGSKKGKKSKK